MNGPLNIRPLTFAELWRLGYGPRLLPIVPPNAEVSETSTLYKRVGTPRTAAARPQAYAARRQMA